jgi:hypothetical protein
MKNLMIEAQNMEDRAKNYKQQFMSTESYIDISSPELKKENFKYLLPEGAVLKESMNEEMLDSLPGKNYFLRDIVKQQRSAHQNNPIIYWCFGAMILFFAISLCAYSFYRNRK